MMVHIAVVINQSIIIIEQLVQHDGGSLLPSSSETPNLASRRTRAIIFT